MLVTGIQPPRVRAVNDSLRQSKESPAPKDMGVLDSCDEHRNDGGGVSAPDEQWKGEGVCRR
ncbi:hypothetical protein EFD55_24080 [Rhizobium pisi]|uniref:Uncharacterized protein n=1 Tax=Rhizobium pisi TaxID=574561 RepID=A0A3R9BI48_9HYPH|nr:hypothetical protein EFD55_24080 [Rhizobium pisi]